MIRSLRLRLQLWYAVVLVVVVGGLAAALYFQVRRDRLRAIDARLESAASYLQATIRGLPPHEMDQLWRGGPRRRPEDVEFRGEPPPPDHRGPAGDQPPRIADQGPPDHARPPRGDGPLGRRPRGGPFPPRPPAERLLEAIELPGSLLDSPGERSVDWPYFAIWRSDGGVLAASDEAPTERPPVAERRAVGPPFRWQSNDRREMLLAGPHGTLILVGKPAGRELAELRWFAWRLIASGGRGAGDWFGRRVVDLAKHHAAHRRDRRHGFGDFGPQPGAAD